MRALTVCLVACALASTASAATLRPAIVSVHVHPAGATVLPSSGAPVTMSAVVRHATTCSFLSQRAVGAALRVLRTVRCERGRASFTFPAVPNPSASSARIVYAVRVSKSVERRLSLAEAATVSTPPQPPIVGLQTCSAGPDCDYGPVTSTYPNYGNAAPDALGYAAFAAAANWEQIVVGVHPDTSTIQQQFAAAGGTSTGLNAAQLFAYWGTHSITGLTLMARQAVSLDQPSVEQAVRDHRALVAELRFTSGDTFGQYAPTAGSHPAIVDGFTPAGPLVVSWGETLQVTWAQWRAAADGLWWIGTGVP